MIVATMCLAAFLGAVCGSIGVLAFGVSMIGGVGIYFGITMSITCFALFCLLRRPLPDREDLKLDWV